MSAVAILFFHTTRVVVVLLCDAAAPALIRWAAQSRHTGVVDALSVVCSSVPSRNLTVAGLGDSDN